MTTTNLIKVLAASAIALGGQVAFAHGGKAIDDALSGSAKCSCRNAGDCTCKKGECKCKACGNGKAKLQVFETLRGDERKLELPQNARYEATGGVFI